MNTRALVPIVIIFLSRSDGFVQLKFATSHGAQYQRTAFDDHRDHVIEFERSLQIGGQLKMSAAEMLVDAHLKHLKRTEFDAGITDPANYAPGLHFFVARPLVERSAVFRLLRRMPKGAMLHGHNTAMVSGEWIVQNLSYRPDMLRCTTADGELRLTFRRVAWHQCTTEYVRVVDQRAAASDQRAYDEQLERNLNMFSEQPHLDYPDVNAAWKAFDKIFRIVSDVITYEHTFRVLYRRMLQEMYDDNVMYLELRTGFTLIYYDDNRIATEVDVVHELQAIISDFKRINPKFLGMKFIYSKSRNTEDVDELLQKYRILKAKFPDLIVGFDLVGQEDVGKPLYMFIDKLLANRDIDYMFHAGETDWNGYGSDRNILDAILLNTTRIGHGYALVKHPVLMDMVRRRHICLEVCPISNQVLGLVSDLRNHPATVYSALNVPMVISSDDPGFWGATGLSYDFYYALMSFTTVDTGLAYVKQLALNALRYSRLDVDERRLANSMFSRQWRDFLDSVISTEKLSAEPH